jgi:hypothetical protein
MTGRLSEDAGYLRCFIRDYLGIADAAFQPVYQQCQQDHRYLTVIVRAHVTSLREQAVLHLLHQSMDGKRLAQRLGFDALDPRRAQAYRMATSYINRRQMVVLIAALCVSVFMLLFPPWIEERWRTQVSLGEDSRVKLLESRSVGYGLWSSHQSHTDVRAEGKGFLNLFPAHDGQETVYRLDLRLLAIQFLILGGLSAILVVVLRNTKRTYSEYLVQCGASMLPARIGGDAETTAPPETNAIT